MTSSPLRISIDPGLSATGIALWPPEGGRPTIKTIRPTGDTWQAKIADLIPLIMRLFSQPVREIAVEDFVNVYPKLRANSLRKLFTATGAIIGCALAQGIPVSYVCKGTIPKHRTNLIAQLYATENRAPQDALDAIYIGLLAGYNKPIA